MISGAAAIGLGIARVLAEHGWQLSLGVRDPAEAADGAGGQARIWLSAMRPRDLKAAADWAKADPPTATAASTRWSPCRHHDPQARPTNASDDEVEQILDVNVKAPLRWCAPAWPWLVMRQGPCGDDRLACRQRVPRALRASTR